MCLSLRSRCVKFEESNDKTQLIFGSVSVIQARDAAPLTVSLCLELFELDINTIRKKRKVRKYEHIHNTRVDLFTKYINMYITQTTNCAKILCKFMVYFYILCGYLVCGFIL